MTTQKRNGEETGPTQEGDRQNQRFNADGTERLGASATESAAARDIQNTVGDPTSQRGSFIRSDSDRRTIAGGILRQLMKQSSNQLAYHELQVNYHSSQVDYHSSQVEELKSCRNQLEKLSDELQVNTGEDLESDTDEPPGAGEEE